VAFALLWLSVCFYLLTFGCVFAVYVQCILHFYVLLFGVINDDDDDDDDYVNTLAPTATISTHLIDSSALNLMVLKGSSAKYVTFLEDRL